MTLKWLSPIGPVINLTPNWFMILMNHRHLFLSMGRSTINALIIDLPMDRNKCLCNEPWDQQMKHITGFVTRLTQQVPLVEQVLLTLSEHLSSPPVFCSCYSIFSFMCMFCRLLFVLLSKILSFSFGHCVVCSSLIYRFWLPIWYLQSLLLT